MKRVCKVYSPLGEYNFFGMENLSVGTFIIALCFCLYLDKLHVNVKPAETS